MCEKDVLPEEEEEEERRRRKKKRVGNKILRLRRQDKELDIAAVTDGVPCRGDPKLTPD